MPTFRPVRTLLFASLPTLLILGVFSLGFVGEPENDPWLNVGDSATWGLNLVSGDAYLCRVVPSDLNGLPDRAALERRVAERATGDRERVRERP